MLNVGNLGHYVISEFYWSASHFSIHRFGYVPAEIAKSNSANVQGFPVITQIKVQNQQKSQNLSLTFTYLQAKHADNVMIFLFFFLNKIWKKCQILLLDKMYKNILHACSSRYWHFLIPIVISPWK